MGVLPSLVNFLSPLASRVLSTCMHVIFIINYMVKFADKMYRDRALGASSLVVIALAHGLALFAAVAASMNISGGHVNPAVTFGALVGGRITFLRALFYWVAQLLGAVFASLILKLATDGMVCKRN